MSTRMLPRIDGIGKSLTTLKSGRYRAGTTKIRTQVNWPDDFCSVPVGSKQPTYDELSNDQWVQGFLFCILEEKKTLEKQCYSITPGLCKMLSS